MLAVSILIPLLIGIWVAMDARKRGCSQWKAFGWFLGVWFVLIVFLPLYLILRSRSSSSASSIKKKGPEKGTYVCPYCGRIYKEKASFCPYCGQKLNDDNNF